MSLEIIRNNGIRFYKDVEEILLKCSEEELRYIVNYSKKNSIFTLDKSKVVAILEKRAESIEVVTQKQVLARDIDEDIKVRKDNTILKTVGNVESFVSLYRSRFIKIARLFPPESNDEFLEIDDYRDLDNTRKKIQVIGMVFRKNISKEGNLVLDLEIPTHDKEEFGIRRFVVKKDDVLFEKKDQLLEDDVIRIKAEWLGNIGIVKDIEYPDLNQQISPKRTENDVGILYISDLHFGSKHTNKKKINKVVEFLKYNQRASFIKYVVIVGDNVEGIGIYPEQEKELEVVEIDKQYKQFMEFIESLPDHVVPIFIPGNHDATTRNEPTQIILKDLVDKYKYSLPNPVYVDIHGVKHLIYHGTSLDSYINTIPGMSYQEGGKAAIEMVKRRHLSSILNGNPVAPFEQDILVMDELPHVFPLGHIHKRFHLKYKGMYIINPGTFQEQTPFQKKVNLNPDVGYGYVLNLRTMELMSVTF